MRHIHSTAFALMIMTGVILVRAEAAEHAAVSENDAYPLKTCVVSGESLDAMGEPVVYEIKFCCESCVDDFLKDPKTYLAKLEAARESQATGEHSQEAEGHDSGSEEHGSQDQDGHEGHNH